MNLMVTGGIGCGKSTVLLALQERGFHLLLADNVSKEIMMPGEACFEQLKEAFGTGILKEGGGIDRRKFAELIYRDPHALKMCNDIVHPMTVAEIENRIARIREAEPDADICMEAAIPVEGLLRIADEIWYVYADREIRIRRLAEGRGYSEAYSRGIIDNQPGEEAFALLADHIIDNSGTVDETRARVAELLDGRGACTAEETAEECGSEGTADNITEKEADT